MPTDIELEEEDEIEEEEADNAFNKASKDSDKWMAWMFTLAGLGALNVLNNSLNGKEKEAVKSYYISQGRSAIGNIGTVTRELPVIERTVIEEIYYLAPEDLLRYNQILEETLQYNRILDPKTVENLAFNQQQKILDQVGMFGGVESEKQGTLSQYLDEKVVVRWTTCEDNGTCDTDAPVCDDCEDLRGRVFTPEEFPEPPHYGCRCNDPMSEPELISIAGEDFPI